MKILLIEPKYGYKEALPWIPIGKAYLAGVLREHGFEVRIIDNALKNYDDETIVRLIKNFSPDIVGTGGMTLQFADAKRIVKLVRQCHNEALVVGGGIHLTLVPDDGVYLFDFVIIGEGEYAFLELCKRYEETGRDRNKNLFRDIHGLYFGLKNSEIIRTETRELIYDLDKLLLPAYDLLEVEKYHDFLISKKKAVSIMTGRGCPFDCEFCASPALSLRRVRYFSLDYVLHLMRYLTTKYGFENFRIMDDTFAIDKKRVIEFCKRIIDEGLRFDMTCLTHVKTCDFEMFKKMKEAGFSIIALGIESGNDNVLKLINKKITRETAANAVRLVRDAGMAVEALFMIGNIGETRETIEDTIAFAKKFNPPYEGNRRIGYNWFQFATPFPGSRFYMEAKDYGQITSFNYDDYSHQTPVFIPKGLDVNTMIRLHKQALKETNSPHPTPRKALLMYLKRKFITLFR